MNVINIDKAVDNACTLTKTLSSTKVFVNSLKILRFNSKNIFRKIIFLIFELVFSIIIICQSNTILLVKDIYGLLITILIAFIAIVFTGYAFFQALLNDKLLVTLLSVDENEGNLCETNEYFAEVMIFQMVCTLLDIGVVIFAMIIPTDWILLSNKILNEIISGTLIVISLYCNFESIWEMKSFIFNVFQLFNLHACARMVDIKEKEDNK